ncbi:MAG TPA: small acid-soluble spore protein Tlp [Syntrophomonas sp.]|nr:small acid-soluble spore protein Tlp [Syntrophomonas sp.]
MKHNPDDRRDNVEKIQRNITSTIRNMEAAEEMMTKTDDKKTENNLADKNDQRRKALKSMRKEIKDEATDRERGYD